MWVILICFAVTVLSIRGRTAASNGPLTDFELKLGTDTAVRRTSDKFVSVTLDAAVIVNRWESFDPTSPVAVMLGGALQPSYLRVGGSPGDSLIFVGQGDFSALPNTTFNATDWDKLNTFTQQANLTLIFGLNSLYRQPGAPWDPSNAIALLKYSAQKGYMFDLELGNEPDYYDVDHYVAPQQLAADFGTLRGIMNNMSTFQYSRLVGPDVTKDDGPMPLIYLESFMKFGSQYIDAMTFHHYYMKGSDARPQDFVNPTLLDSFKTYLTIGQQIIDFQSQGTQSFWLGETSSAYGGGAPGLSNAFLAGFMWLDKLGLCARYGAKVVMRQQFVGMNYGLVDYTNGIYTPNPDYWLTLLFKNLVGEVVLDSQGGDEKLRVYGHCSGKRSGYVPGSVTFYMMNLYNTTKTVSFSQFPDKELHIYVLSSGNPNSLISRSVKLNGKLLELNGNQFPPFIPVVQNSSTVEVAPFTMEFVVVPNARAATCV